MTAYFFVWIYLQRSRWRQLQGNSTTTAVFLLNLVSQTASTTWNSKTDFSSGSTPKLNPWEQLAHVLLCTNEFLFVD